MSSLSLYFFIFISSITVTVNAFWTNHFSMVSIQTHLLFLWLFSESLVSHSLPPHGWSMPGFPVLHYILEFAQTLSVGLMMPSNNLILCCPLLLFLSIFPSSRVFSNELVLCIRWLKCWTFSFRSVLPMNIQGWLTLGLTNLISLQSKGLSKVFSSTTVWKH